MADSNGHLVLLYIQLLILVYGQDVKALLTINANQSYIIPYKPLTINCTSTVPSLGTSVVFGVNGTDMINVKYFNPGCKFIYSGTSLAFDCTQDVCSCGLEGLSFTWTYSGDVVTDSIQLYCSMTFTSPEKVEIDIPKADAPSGIRIYPDKAIFRVNETEQIETIECLAVCVPVCNYSWTTPNGVQNRSVLYMPDANRNETGNYTCTAWNSFDSVNVTVQIFVQYRPSITIIPSENPYKIKENDQNVTISCIVQDAFPISNIRYRLTLPNGTVEVSQNYTISFVKRMYSGIYTCSAWNEAGTSNDARLTVDVLYGPVIEVMNNVNVSEFRPFKQICDVSANPNVTEVWWTKSKETVVFMEGSLLNIQNMTRQLSGEFTCHAENHLNPSNGEIRNITNKGSFSIDVQHGPEISKIGNVNVTELSDFIATCTVNANPRPLRVWWTRGEDSNFLQRGSVLTLNKISKHSSDYFTCHAENMLHLTYPIVGENEKKNASSSFYVNVQYGPMFSTIGNVDVIESELFNMSCNVSSNPLPNRIWWTRSDNAEIFDGTNLIFLKISRKKADNYTCHAENVLHPSNSTATVRQTSSNSFYINVQYGPGNSTTIFPPLLQINVTEKKDIINITCQADCNPPCTYEWAKNASYAIASGHLIDQDVHRSDAGNYTCTAKPKLSTISSKISMEINVLYAATILKISPITTINESRSFKLECKVDSFPLSTITWTLNRTQQEVWKESGVSISKYSAEHASCNHTGKYACSAYSGIAPTAFQYTELRILCSPRPSNEYLSSISPIGIGDSESLNITVYFVAYPKPKSIRWIFYKNRSSESIEKKSKCYNYGLFEHKACFLKSNVTEADFGTYTLQVNYTDLVIWEKHFVVVGNRRPDPPWQVNISCGIGEVHINWKSGYDGGEKQTFYILIVINKSSRLIMSKDFDNEHGTPFTEIVTLPSGAYMFAIFTNNSYGNATSDNSNCTINARKLKINGSASVISAVAGSIGGIIVICALAAAVFLFVRKRMSINKRKDKDMLQRSCLHNVDEEDDQLKDNPMYVSSEPNGSETKSSSDVYSVVNKEKWSSVKNQLNTDTAVYSQVVRKNKKGKGIAVKKEKQVKDKFIEMDSVYENSNDIKERQTNDVYAKTTGNELQQNGNITRKNKDGLIYADLDLASGPSGSKFVIRGLENRNNYAIIDLTKTAEPLPSDSDNEDVNEQEKE